MIEEASRDSTNLHVLYKMNSQLAFSGFAEGMFARALTLRRPRWVLRGSRVTPHLVTTPSVPRPLVMAMVSIISLVEKTWSMETFCSKRLYAKSTLAAMSPPLICNKSLSKLAHRSSLPNHTMLKMLTGELQWPGRQSRMALFASFVGNKTALKR